MSAASSSRTSATRPARTSDGRTFRARTFISNIDPKACVALIGPARFPRRFQKKVDYEYSVSSYTLYLGVKGLDLREFGFGSWNIWHYPHLDINRAYHAQAVDGDLSDPWFFLSTPSLYSQSGHPGEQDLPGRRTDPRGRHRLATSPSGPSATDRAGYGRRKVAERMLNIMETHRISGFPSHLHQEYRGWCGPPTNAICGHRGGTCMIR